MTKEEYMQKYEEAKSKVKAIKAGRTGHTRWDVAFNQIEHGMSMAKQAVKEDVPWFKCSDWT